MLQPSHKTHNLLFLVAECCNLEKFRETGKTFFSLFLLIHSQSQITNHFYILNGFISNIILQFLLKLIYGDRYKMCIKLCIFVNIIIVYGQVQISSDQRATTYIVLFFIFSDRYLVIKTDILTLTIRFHLTTH